MRAYVVSLGDRAFVYLNYEVRVAPGKWDWDFAQLDRHITNGGGADAHHERRFLADEFPELDAACALLFGYLCRVVEPPQSLETTDSQAADWTPAAVMGLDVMVDTSNGLYLLESNHSPASPPFDDMSRFGLHVRRFAKNVVALLVFVAGGARLGGVDGADTVGTQCEARFHFKELLE